MCVSSCAHSLPFLHMTCRMIRVLHANYILYRKHLQRGVRMSTYMYIVCSQVKYSDALNKAPKRRWRRRRRRHHHGNAARARLTARPRETTANRLTGGLRRREQNDDGEEAEVFAACASIMLTLIFMMELRVYTGRRLSLLYHTFCLCLRRRRPVCPKVYGASVFGVLTRAHRNAAAASLLFLTRARPSSVTRLCVLCTYACVCNMCTSIICGWLVACVGIYLYAVHGLL